MPLEQVAGRASHRSDLYGAAATALFLLTARNPAELPTKSLKVDLSGIMDLSPRLDAVLSSWLEPDVERRNLGAAEAASILRGETRVETTSRREAERSRAPAGAVPNAAASHTAAPSNRKQPGMARTPAPLPADSRLEVEESLDGIRVFFPRAKPRISSAPIAGFAVFWLAFVAFWTMMTLRMRAPLFFPLFSIPFWGVGIAMARAAFGAVFTSRELILDGDGLRIRTKGLGMEKAESWPLADLGEVKVQPSRFQVQGSSTNELLLEAGTRKISIGSGLSDRELLFLEDKLGDTIERLRGT